MRTLALPRPDIHTAVAHRPQDPVAIKHTISLLRRDLELQAVDRPWLGLQQDQDLMCACIDQPSLLPIRTNAQAFGRAWGHLGKIGTNLRQGALAAFLEHQASLIEPFLVHDFEGVLIGELDGLTFLLAIEPRVHALAEKHPRAIA